MEAKICLLFFQYIYQSKKHKESKLKKHDSVPYAKN